MVYMIITLRIIVLVIRQEWHVFGPVSEYIL